MGTLLADPQPDTQPTADRNKVRQAIERLAERAKAKRLGLLYVRIEGKVRRGVKVGVKR